MDKALSVIAAVSAGQLVEYSTAPPHVEPLVGGAHAPTSGSDVLLPSGQSATDQPLPEPMFRKVAVLMEMGD